MTAGADDELVDEIELELDEVLIDGDDTLAGSDDDELVDELELELEEGGGKSSGVFMAVDKELEDALTAARGDAAL